MIVGKTTWILVLTISILSLVATCDDEDAIAQYNLRYDRTKSRVMVRLITKPSLANLDYSAYDRNPLFYRADFPKLIQPQRQFNIDELHFDNSIVPSSIRDRIEELPLADSDMSNPMAWAPMIDYLAEWDYDQTIELMKIGVKVSQQKWGNDNVRFPIQQITTAFLDTKKNELWVKIEFEPNANFIDRVDDEDKDGFREIYGLIDRSKYSRQLIDYLKSNYIQRELSEEEIKSYYYKLSAKWYESVKTETLDMNIYKQFPNDRTEPEIIDEVKGLKIERATAIIRGTPYGNPIYNVFVVKVGSQGSSSKNPLDTADPESDNINQIIDELKRWGSGSWENWSNSLSEFYKDIKDMLSQRPPEIKGFVGKDGFLFFRGSLEYLLSGDLRNQKNNRDPFPAIVDYKDQLKSKGKDFLFVIIPSKAEIYPDKLSDNAPPLDGACVTPYTRKLILELEQAGVEVVDLMPAFMEARRRNESLYMKLDTHWDDSGVQLAAKLIAERIKRYPWYSEVCKKPISYKVREVKFTRSGDIRDMLPDNEKILYRPMSLTAHQVLNPDGSLYKDDESSPIVILGDSFCGVFQVEEPKSAGLSAHIAKELGMPVDLMVAYGTGPGIRKNLARRGSEVIKAKKLIIWTTASRDLYNYWAPWDLVKVP